MAAQTTTTTTPAAPAHTKVFVGNLSYKTKDEGLKDSFTNAGLKVVNANIIVRGARSMGYGFVEFDNEAEAKKAVETMNKKELDGREINVELAKPREESDKAQRPPSSGYPRGGRGGRGRGGRGRGRGGWGGRGGRGGWGGRGGRGGRGRGGARGGRGRGGRGGYYGGYRRFSNNERPAGEERQGNPSPTTLFVANLPFSLDDKGLSDVFKEFNLKSAHVVKRQNGKSKGFGFVEFNSQEDQQAALNAVNANKKTVEGRELVVRVALNSADGQAPEGAEAKAPAATAPAEKKEEKTA